MQSHPKKNYQINAQSSLLILCMLFVLFSCQNKGDLSDEDKVETLLNKMTLEEKLGQMTQICFSEITLSGDKTLEMNPELFRDFIVDNHVGSFLSGTGSSEKWITFITNMQKVAVEETRLGIPLLIGIDHIHGANYVDEGTMLPHNITLSCSFDRDIVSEAAKITAIETSHLGMLWNFAPVLDVGKNPYWPRLYETYGEDPLVVAELGASFITTYQDPQYSEPYKLAACAKHFIGYSDPKSGWDRTPAEIPPQIMNEHFLPPFKKAIESGVLTVMANSGEVNGVPVHVSEELLNDLLRKELGFEGVLLTDIKDINKVYEEHHGAFSEKDATLRAINASIDMSMACNSVDFIGIMKELIDEGEISIERIDESVRRILKLKFDLGLFDNPYPSMEGKDRPGSPEHVEKAITLAEESIVLLKNQDDLLPLQNRQQNILVTGFAADSKKMLNGAWTLEWMGAEEERQPENMQTLFQGISNAFDRSFVSLYKTGYDGGTDSEMEFRSAVRKNDIIIITIGEEPYSEFKGNISNLDLPDQQKKLVRIAAEEEKKIILVMIEGRPRLITDTEPLVDAILFAGYPGQGGANAIASILSGTTNPSGKLSFSYPLYPGHHVPYYHKAFDKAENLYDFGYGMSYTTFAYDNFVLDKTSFSDPQEELTVTFDLENTGEMKGKEVIQLYFRQEKGTITRPVKKLFYFDKILLEPGEKQSIELKIDPAESFAYPDKNNEMIFEKGVYTIMLADQEIQVKYE